MAKIIGNPTVTPMAVPDWNQNDSTKADYIKNKPTLGKGLSTNDFTNAYKEKVDNDTFDGYVEDYDYTFSFGEDGIFKTNEGEILINKTTYGEDNSYCGGETYLYRNGEVYWRNFGDEEGWENDWTRVSVTSADLNKKVDRVSGKGLSTNDFTDALKSKLESISGGGSGSDIVVDDKLSLSSTNPVQNKIITSALSEKANKENAFDYYIEINQDEIFEYDRYTDIGTYLLCQKTVEDYSNPPWQYYKLLTVVDGDPDHLVQTEYDLSNGGCRKRDNYDKETYMGGDWKPWVDVFASKNDLDNKVNKVDGKGLSTNDFTDSEKEKLKKLYPLTESECFNYSSYTDFISYLNSKTGQGIEIINWDEHEVEEINECLIFNWGVTWSGDIGNCVVYQTLSYPNGDILRRIKLIDNEWISIDDFDRNEWKKISVSQTDLDNAIGDIEASLESIIAKYGLGGDVV